MARKSTRYLIGERWVEGTGRDRRVRWSWIAPPVPGTTSDWAWTGDRKRATRFAGRAEARAFADRAVAWMAANGYPGVVLYLVPATGGVPVGAPAFD